MYYSKSTGAFLDSPENYQNFPDDAVEITDELYAQVMLNKPPEMVIVADENGFPVLVDHPSPTNDQLKEAAFAKRDELLRKAALRIAPLQDAVDLGSATNTETGNLLLWKQYRVSVNRIDSQTKFPVAIVWPPVPV